MAKVTKFLKKYWQERGELSTKVPGWNDEMAGFAATQPSKFVRDGEGIKTTDPTEFLKEFNAWKSQQAPTTGTPVTTGTPMAPVSSGKKEEIAKVLGTVGAPETWSTKAGGKPTIQELLDQVQKNPKVVDNPEWQKALMQDPAGPMIMQMYQQQLQGQQPPTIASTLSPLQPQQPPAILPPLTPPPTTQTTPGVTPVQKGSPEEQFYNVIDNLNAKMKTKDGLSKEEGEAYKNASYQLWAVNNPENDKMMYERGIHPYQSFLSRPKAQEFLKTNGVTGVPERNKIEGLIGQYEKLPDADYSLDDLNFAGLSRSPRSAKAKYDMIPEQAKQYAPLRALASGGSWNPGELRVKTKGKFHFNPFKKMDIGGFITEHPFLSTAGAFLLSPVAGVATGTASALHTATQPDLTLPKTDPGVAEALQKAQITDPTIKATEGIVTTPVGQLSEGVNKLTLMNPEQERLQKFQANQSVMNTNFPNIAREAQRSFYSDIVPGITQRFGASTGNLRSSGLEDALGRAGGALASNLAAQQGQFGLQQGSLALGQRPFENIYKSREPKWYEPLLQGAASGTTKAVGAALL